MASRVSVSLDTERRTVAFSQKGRLFSAQRVEVPFAVLKEIASAILHYESVAELGAVIESMGGKAEGQRPDAGAEPAGSMSVST